MFYIIEIKVIQIFNETGKYIEDVVLNSEKVQGLIAEVAAASEEQAKAIAHINTGVSEVEKLIHQNAANSEESAATSEEIYAHTAKMDRTIEGLVRYVFAVNRDKIKRNAANASDEDEY